MMRLLSQGYLFISVSAFFAAALPSMAGAVEGTIYDGPASTARIRVEGFGSSTWKVPLANAAIEIHSLAPGKEATWKGTTGEDGTFNVNTGKQDGAGQGAPFAIVASSGNRELFTGSFSPASPKPIVLFAYPVSKESDRVRSTTRAYHTIVKKTEGYLLKVQLDIELVNGSDTLYVGQKNTYGDNVVYAVPVPASATILKNSGPVPGTRMRTHVDPGEGEGSRGARYLVIDEPVVGLADLAANQQDSQVRGWALEYTIPAADWFSLSYPQLLTPMGRAEGRPPGFLVYVPEGEMEIDPGLSPLEKLTTMKEPPPGGIARSFDVYAMSATKRHKPGSPILVALKVSDVAIGEVSETSLLWHAGTLSVIVLAIVSGLLLGRRKGQPVSVDVQAGDNFDEVLDQIAKLDTLSASGSISPEEYSRQREVLVEIAACELEEDGGTEASSETRAPTSEATRKLISRISEIDSSQSNTVEDAQERGHLLEALYKSIIKDQEA